MVIKQRRKFSMSKPKVYITREIPEKGLKMIMEHFIVDIWPEYGPPPKHVIIEKVRDADALVTLLSDKIDSEVFDAAPKLKIIAQMAVGYDNIDVEEATKRGIYVTNTPGVLTETTADFAWALLMAVARRVVEADRYVREGKWKVSWHPSMLLGKDIYGATLGIIGAGRIGSAVARRAKCFNMKILYYDVVPNPQIEKETGARFVDLETLLKESDFITIHVPLTKETYRLIDAEKLKLVKNTAYIINTARGPVIDEKALYEALKEGRLAGAALDVFEQEPISMDNPLLKLDNVILTPHIASASYETRSKMAEMVAENLIAFFEKRKPPNLVNPEVMKIRPLSSI
jgi:glyoxylate reductase